MLIDPRALTYALLPLPSSPLHKSKPSLDGLSSREQEADSSSVSRTSSESSFTSSSSSSSADSAVRSYVASTSSSRATTSTRITSPVTSDYGRNLANQVETITIASSHSRSQSDPQPSIRGQPRPLAATSTRRRRSQAEIRKETYTDEDWAKDVRWLAPNTLAQSESHHPLPPDFILPTDIPPASPTGTSSRLLQQQLRGPASYPPPAKSAEHRKRTRRSRGSRSSRGRMSALLEEDESEYSDATASASSAEPSRAPSPVQEEPPEVKEIASASSPLAASVTRSRSHRSTKERSSSDEGSENPDARLLAYARSNGHPRRSYSNTRPLSRATDSSAYSQTLPTHAIPNPTTSGESASIVHGYSSLTLPRAGYTGDGKAAVGDGKIDLVRAGIAQSSMATVEVTRGVAQQRPTTDVRRKRRTFSFSLSLKFDLKGLKGKGREARTPAHLLDVLPLPVEFTAHLPPPSYVPSQHVLMQVFAVGLDALDSILVQEKVASGAKGAGFIPGRSVVGKVIEVGWEVKGDVCKRGDWVVGLLDVRKVSISPFV
ncbi:hypothetical protein PHLCEN_2v2251 [Hermanssonia centrifuga]|uniref:Uncharacterized protein n=1 Tax=Hermanssonia centrifuga TaxID=98765 RepID=A0A2R6RPT9_9APHY|nr:hypothetical protein PHLCEN_2v2251 [Hermanssonia centrifuga]